MQLMSKKKPNSAKILCDFWKKQKKEPNILLIWAIIIQDFCFIEKEKTDKYKAWAKFFVDQMFWKVYNKSTEVCLQKVKFGNHKETFWEKFP